jgi:predicted TIM-barrel fold metal-dependent hydrolase
MSAGYVDADGHIMENMEEISALLEAPFKDGRLANLPSLDRFHVPTGTRGPSREGTFDRSVDAQRWLQFLDKTALEYTVLYPTTGLAYGQVVYPDWAVAYARAYNTWLYEHYVKVSPRLKGVALIPMQDVPAAVLELRRAVTELGMVAAMIPSNGLTRHISHKEYWPIYEEAEKLDCALGVHGGSNLEGAGLNTFTNFTASHVLHHPLPLMVTAVSFIYHGVFDRFPGLRVAFLEGGCAWLASILDRAERDENYFDRQDQPKQHPVNYFRSGRILIGCEGSEHALAYLAKRVGIEPFAYASDYPHEVDLPAAKHEIGEIAERADLSDQEKQAVLADNAKRFFKL